MGLSHLHGGYGGRGAADPWDELPLERWGYGLKEHLSFAGVAGYEGGALRQVKNRLNCLIKHLRLTWLTLITEANVYALN